MALFHLNADWGACISVKGQKFLCVLKPWTALKNKRKTLAVIFWPFFFFQWASVQIHYTTLPETGLATWGNPGARYSSPRVQRDRHAAASYMEARRRILGVVVTGDCGKCSLESSALVTISVMAASLKVMYELVSEGSLACPVYLSNGANLHFAGPKQGLFLKSYFQVLGRTWFSVDFFF